GAGRPGGARGDGMTPTPPPLGVAEPPLEVPAERPGQPPRALTAHDLEGVEVAAQLMLGLVGGRPQDEERKAVPIEPADGRLDVGPRRAGGPYGPPRAPRGGPRRTPAPRPA